MKNLSSLTTFFITFLIVVYLGIFSGLKINGFISNKRLVAVSSASASSTAPQASPQVSVLAAVTVQTAPVASAKDQSPAASAVDTSTPVPAPVSDTQPPPPPPPPPAPSEPPPSDRCIVTISGGQYDVTDYRNIHSGGDVFACGGDMTAAFLSQHPASFLQKMSKYRV